MNVRDESVFNALDKNAFIAGGGTTGLEHTDFNGISLCDAYQRTQVIFPSETEIMWIRFDDAPPGNWSNWIKLTDVFAKKTDLPDTINSGSLNGTYYAFGWITGGGKTLDIIIPYVHNSNLTTINITSAKCSFRISGDTGGYIGGSTNVELVSKLTTKVFAQHSVIRLSFEDATSFGTNNTCVAGSITLQGTVS